MTNEIDSHNGPLFWLYIKWSYAIILGLLLSVSCSNKYFNIRKFYIKLLLKLFKLSVTKTANNKHFIEAKDSNTSQEFSPDDSSSSIQSDVEGYQLKEIFRFARSGIKVIMEDSVLPHFVSEKLPYWNLLSRNNSNRYELESARLTFCWVIGCFIRYGLLLPMRVIILFIGLLLFCVCTVLIGFLPGGEVKRRINAIFTMTCFKFVAGCLSLVATFHNSENKPKHGIAVANHTAPIDALVLSTDQYYDMVGQRHGGILGCLMSALSKSSSHIWFEREIAAQRHTVYTRLQEHAADESLPPVLIFPEGVCVNNRSVMQFKKGGFEIDTEIFPIAIKFDPRFGDAFWWQDYFSSYALGLMTSWAIVCDVWYLPPVRRKPDETAVQFANRVKATIAAKAGLFDSSWDGFLKSREVKHEWKEAKQLEFANYLISKSQFVNESDA